MYELGFSDFIHSSGAKHNDNIIIPPKGFCRSSANERNKPVGETVDALLKFLEERGVKLQKRNTQTTMYEEKYELQYDSDDQLKTYRVKEALRYVLYKMKKTQDFWVFGPEPVLYKRPKMAKNGRFWVMGQVRQVRLQVSWASGFSIHSLGPRDGSHSTARAQWASRVATCRLTFLSHLWDGIMGWSGPHDREPVIRGVDGEPWSAAAAPPS